jgi:hypothetical protein
VRNRARRRQKKECGIVNVKLTYFKQSGKYYSEGTLQVTTTKPWEIYTIVRQLLKTRRLPELVDNHDNYIVLVDIPDGVPAAIVDREGSIDAQLHTADENGQTRHEFMIATLAAQSFVTADYGSEFVRTFGNQIVNACKKEYSDPKVMFQMLKDHYEAAILSLNSN